MSDENFTRKDEKLKRIRETEDEAPAIKKGKRNEINQTAEKENSPMVNKSIRDNFYQFAINDEMSPLNTSEKAKHKDNLSNSSNKYTSLLFDSFPKNDVMNLVWKLVISKDEILKISNNGPLVIDEVFLSRRKDKWRFNLEIHKKGLTFGISLLSPENSKNKVNSENEENSQISNSAENEETKHKYNHSNSNGKNNLVSNSNELPEFNTNTMTNPEFQKDLNGVLNSLYFNLDVSLNILSYKTSSFSFENVQCSGNNIKPEKEYKKEIPLTTDFFTMSFLNNSAPTRSSKGDRNNEDGLVIIIDVTFKKCFEIQTNKIPGFTGIVNEAATCYMNSMLQTLNIFGYFKKAVFQIPITEEDFKNYSVSLSLQRLFYDLLMDTEPISTNRLVRSFGWGKEQISVQHDVQEFNLLLSEVMEKKMKGTPSEGTFSQLFEGRLINYIKCVNVDYKSEKEERFCDLQLTIKNCKNINESLELYTEEELLDNSNKYQTEVYGKQTAKKGIRFTKFPNILILQLKRFEYNQKKDAMVKINDFFEFYEELDLSKYMDQSAEKGNTYTLHSVVVHQGNANSGHYYAFIRPGVSNSWLLFNDEIVRPADYYEVFNSNFGGSYKTYKHKSKGEVLSSTNYFENNAYILVYIRNSERQKILSPISPKDINLNIRSYFELEKIEEKKQKMKKMRITENMNVVVFSNDSVVLNHKNKLGIVNSFSDYNHDEPFFLNKNQRMIINLPKMLSIFEFLQFIKTQSGIPVELIKIYKYEIYDQTCDLYIRNRSLFKLEEILDSEYEKTMFDFTNGGKKKLICLYIHILNKSFTLFSIMKKSHHVEEIIMSDKKIAFISKEVNKFAFNLNHNLISELPALEKKENLPVVFLKEYNLQTYQLEITDVFLLDFSKFKSFYQFKTNLLQMLKYNSKEEFSILVEKYNDSQNYNLFITKENFNLFNSNDTSKSEGIMTNTHYILIPLHTSYENKILSNLEDLYNSICLDVFCLSKNSYAAPKLKINMAEIVDENSLKSLILQEIKSKNYFSNILEMKKNYLINQDKKLFTIDENYLKDNFTVENIQLESQKNNSSRSYLTALKTYPLLKYVNLTDCRIDIRVNLKPNTLDTGNELSFQDISLYDLQNNFVCKLSLILPKKIRKFKEILEHVYDHIIKNFLGEYFYFENFFFVLLNPSAGYIYQLVTDNNSDIWKYESRAENMDFRLQPFLKEQIDLFQDSDYLKVFVCVQDFTGTNSKNMDKVIIRQPFVIFVDKMSSVFNLKLLISDYLQSMKFYKEKDSPPSSIKYYVIKIQGPKINKEINLQQFREEEKTYEVFKDSRVCNILIELHP